jgi:hypothetical protein
VEEEWHCVAAHVQVALVHVGDVRQRVEVLQLWPIGIVSNGSVLAIRNPEDLIEGLPFGKFLGCVIELFADNEIDCLAVAQGLLGQHGYVWADKSNLDLGVRIFYALGQADVTRKAWVLV